MPSPERFDPYFENRMARAKEHAVIARIEKTLLPRKEAQPNKELSNPTIEGMADDFHWSAKAVDNFIDAATKGFIKIVQREENRIQIEFLPIQTLPDELGHITELKTLQKNMAAQWPVFGSSESNIFTYLQTVDFAVEGYMDDETNGKEYARMYIDAPELQKLRNVYLDPESISVTDYEYGFAFAVYGGIPFSSIKQVDVIRAKYTPYKLTDQWQNEDPDEQVNRFREFLDSYGK